VLVIRLISTRRSIPYRYAPVWQALCMVLLTVMAILVTAQVRGWILYAIVLFLPISALAWVHLLPNVRALLDMRRSGHAPKKQ